MPRRVIAIVNPVSGQRNMIPVVREVARLVKQAGSRFEIAETAGAGHATKLASRVGPDVDAVLAVGGDGTVCEIVNGLVDKDVPIVILRTGTENLLARELNMPTVPIRVAQTLLHGEPVPFDVGVINNRRFLAVAGVGFDAECVQRMSRLRTGHITHWDYFWPIWRTFWAHRFPTLRVEVDGTCVFQGRGFVLIGVIPRYSVGMRILAHACYDDGLLDMCIFPCASRVKLAAHACRIFCRRHIDRGGVIYTKGRRVRISSPDEAPIEVDGEVGGFLPADCMIQPGAASFLRLSSSSCTE